MIAFDTKTLLAAFDETVEILSQTPDYITVYDMKDDRELKYRIGPMDDVWLESILHFSPKIEPSEKDAVHDAVIWVLRNIDPNMLVLLKAVYIVVGEEDEAFVAKCSDCEIDEIPDNALSENILGLMWWSESSVFIHFNAIKKCVEEECVQYGEWRQYNRLLFEAITTTMAHELRHLGLSNPFLDEKQYPASEETEEAVEQWALAFCGISLV